MADCGATGSAIDRTAARFISSTLSNGPATESATRAGKAVAGFMGSIATNTSRQTAGTMIPTAPPQMIVAPLNNSHSAITPHPEQFVATPFHPTEARHVVHHGSNFHVQQPQQIPFVQTQHHPMNQQHFNHMHQAQMQAQIQMMNQQMQMMQMHQQQFHQTNIIQQEKNGTMDPISESANKNIHDEWYNDLEEEFESYLESYRRDVKSTADDESDVHHEGFVENASIEQLAAAWAEAEASYTGFDTEDATNLAEPYNIEHDAHQHYDFSDASSNYTLKDPGADFMSEGMKHFKNGNITEAILCFESELKNVDMDNADAWLMLGKCNAENDEDRKAIVCLENAVERDPYSSEALLALGVSYVNELNHEKALKHLKNYVTNNPNYAGMDGLEMSTVREDDALLKVKQLLNKAREYDEARGNLDHSVDILEALGVVCNVTREYDEAVSYFKLATMRKPEDYSLWNKLGATLANSNRSEEAQEAYQRALSMKPKYARAWLNMAISHSNLKNFDESSRCYLQTLSLNPNAVHVWSYLRIALTCSEKWDLLPLAANQDLHGFKEHYDFI